MSPNLFITLEFLTALTRHRIALHFSQESEMPEVPEFVEDDHPFTRLILDHEMTVDEFVTISIALIPHIKPTFFDDLVTEFLPDERLDFKPIGGYRSGTIRTFLPTGETVLFILAGNDVERRFKVQQLFDPDHIFARKKILYLEDVNTGTPSSAGHLVLDTDWVERILFGKVSRPRFGLNFPAERIETQLDWDDLVLPPDTLRQVKELLSWLQHGETLMKDEKLGKRLKPGFRTLFWGPPGTGKTFTAGLLGKHSGRDVYKIDLSMVVSKFIGETEKNLATLFDKAENKDWILFFDEADALFGKRTNVRDAHDKYANQEVSYLLQRVETYNGMVILASNFKSNIDDAFLRRFQSIIHFPMPRSKERLVIWEKTLPEQWALNGVNLKILSDRYELAGAGILNVIQYACLRSLERGDSHLTQSDLREGIVRELNKEGKIVS